MTQFKFIALPMDYAIVSMPRFRYESNRQYLVTQTAPCTRRKYTGPSLIESSRAEHFIVAGVLTYRPATGKLCFTFYGGAYSLAGLPADMTGPHRPQKQAPDVKMVQHLGISVGF